MDIKTIQDYGVELRSLFDMRTRPIGIKFLRPDEETPANAVSPTKDLKCHMAVCQAKAAARRDGKTIVMSKEDHWCWNPLIVYGLVPCEEGTTEFDVVCKYIGVKDPDDAKKVLAGFPKLKYGEFDRLVVGPMESAEFIPDVVLLYCTPAQLRAMLFAAKQENGGIIPSSFDAVDSCAYAVTNPILDGNYRITVPDPGDYERALAAEDEMIFSIPLARLEKFVECSRGARTHNMGYGQLRMNMEYDFARPPFYNELFAIWDLPQGNDWDR